MQRPVHRTALLALTIATSPRFLLNRGDRCHRRCGNWRRWTVFLAVLRDDPARGYSALDLQLGRPQHHLGFTWDAQQPVGFWNSQPGSCLQPYLPERWNVSVLLHTARRMLRHGRHGQGGSCDAHAHAHTYTAADGWSADRHN